jgi:hypothetical protein
MVECAALCHPTILSRESACRLHPVPLRKLPQKCTRIGGLIDLLARAANVPVWTVQRNDHRIMSNQRDLFGHGPAQGSLFGPGEDRLQPPVRSTLPDPEKVRRRLTALLEKARGAEKMPWSEHDARMWQIVFPNMANWLPEDAANQLRFEFAQELERLQRAA